ncbi:Myosin heavy chain IB [Phytophthora cinnamomi]|nr:Myosin heavy chain IB [Phytophthora cinnamomi]
MDLQLAIDMKREPKSGRGLKPQDLMASMPAPGMQRPDPVSARGRRSPDQHREPKSGHGRREPDMQYGPGPGMQREPTSAHGRRNPDAPPMRPPPREQQRAKQIASPRPVRPNAPEPPGGTVYGRDTYDRVAQFAHLAAFEAPPPPPPRPQKPIKPVPVADPLPKYARAPPPSAVRPPPADPGFTIDESQSPMDYDILSPKTARSLAPSVASSATTVVAPGRNRPTPLQQNRRPPPPPTYYENSFEESKLDESKFGESKFDDSRYDESRYGDSRYDESRYDETRFKGGKDFKATNSFDDSFVSEVSSMAWSGVSDDSYYHAAASNTARIPVIEAPQDDDDDRSEDGYSDWGHSTQQSDAFRSTAASDASFFSVNSDFADSKNVFKESEF